MGQLDDSGQTNSTAQASPALQTLPHPQFAARQLTVQVLRTDQLHPVTSGNKWIKLQPWLAKARANGHTGLVTKGGPWSNHLHATAYTAHIAGLACTAIVKARQGMLSPMLQDLLHWGGKILYTHHDQYIDDVHWQHFASQKNALYIPMGGEGPEGQEGVTEFFNALQLPAYDYVLCPIGTGTTFSGIAASQLGYQTLIATDPGIYDSQYPAIIKGLRTQYPGKTFLLQQAPTLLKFGKWPSFLPPKMNEWYRLWQLPTDIVYTAKMLYQLETMVAEDFFAAGSKILLVHTGGLQGNRSLGAGLLEY